MQPSTQHSTSDGSRPTSSKTEEKQSFSTDQPSAWGKPKSDTAPKISMDAARKFLHLSGTKQTSESAPKVSSKDFAREESASSTTKSGPTTAKTQTSDIIILPDEKSEETSEKQDFYSTPASCRSDKNGSLRSDTTQKENEGTEEQAPELRSRSALKGKAQQQPEQKQPQQTSDEGKKTTPNRCTVDRFKKALYNKDTKEILWNTPAEWAKLLIFYLLYYVVLMGVFFGALFVAVTVTGDKKPKFAGIIGNPEVVIRPFGEKGLITFSPNNTETFKEHVDSIGHFLRSEEYEKPCKECKEEKDASSCEEDCKECLRGTNDTAELTEESVCKVTDGLLDWKNILQECMYGYHYGYDEGNPCILLRITTRFDWTPDEEGRTKCFNRYLNITCGHTKAEQKYSMENVTYYSVDGRKTTQAGRISYCYFPFKNQKHYQRPIVMAQFRRFPVTEKPLEFGCWIVKENGQNVTDEGKIGQVTRFKIRMSEGSVPNPRKLLLIVLLMTTVSFYHSDTV